MHTLYLTTGDSVLADFSFLYHYNLSDSILGMNLARDRLLANLQDLRYLPANQLYRLPAIFTAIAVNSRTAIVLDRAIVRILLYITVFITLVFAAIWLLILWHKYPEQNRALLPSSVLRSASLVCLVAFYSSCVGVLKNQHTDEAGMLFADGVLASGSGGTSENPVFTGDNLGSHFYVTNHVGSVEMVTDANGKLLSKYVYEPYGQRNGGLSSTDADGNGSQLVSSRLYTGQEYDPETDLYNYNARLYDPETGRFLQPDEEHTELPGMDSFDRYAYVSGNPVNYVDPDGKKSCLPAVGGNYISMPPLFKPQCGGRDLPGSYIENAMKVYLIGSLGGPELASVALTLYYLTHYPKPALSGVDESAQKHDEQFNTKKTMYEDLHANGRFIGRNIGLFFSPTYYAHTYRCEFNAVPHKFHKIRDLAATINTIATVTGDLLVTVVSAAIFTFGFNPYVMGATMIAGSIPEGRWTIRADRWKIRKARWKVKI